MTGVVTIISKGSLDVLLKVNFNLGDLLVFIAVAGYAAYSVGLRRRPSIHPMSFVAITFTLGVICLFPFYIYEYISSIHTKLSVQSVAAIIYVGIFPSIVSYLCYNRGVELIGPSKAGMFIHLMPVFGSIMAVLFLGESFRLFHAFGIILIGCGIVLTNRK